MTGKEIEKQVIETIKGAFSFNHSNLSDDAQFYEDLGADSLDFVEVIMALEDKFDIAIGDDVAENCKTVGDAVRLVQRLVGVDQENVS